MPLNEHLEGVIVQENENTYIKVHNSKTYTLSRVKSGWTMCINIDGGIYSKPTDFASLIEVEREFKHWQGAAVLIELKGFRA